MTWKPASTRTGTGDATGPPSRGIRAGAPPAARAADLHVDVDATAVDLLIVLLPDVGPDRCDVPRER